MNTLPHILIDDREKAPLSFKNAPNSRERLPYGDYTLRDYPGFIVERKRVDDFCRSISGKRRAAFFSELHRLRDDYRFARLVIIGTPAEYVKAYAMAKSLTGGRLTAASILGTLHAINCKFIPVVRVETAKQAAALIEEWAIQYRAAHHEQSKVIYPNQ
ncbi:MAG: ERCC4 domain-containing protein [Akkermansia sp.]|nr:ERCC4 domain-containing protein [Akkermansia sp.]